jgi:hypothetical protein
MNIFKQFFKSLYSPKDIAMFRFQGIGKTILFVFFLTFISILPSVFYISSAISTGMESAGRVIKEELPAFSIEDGELKTTHNLPITIEENGFTIIFDSSGSISVDDLADTNNVFALLKNDFVLIAGDQVQTYQYSMLNTMKISKEDFLGFVNSIDDVMYILIPIIFIFMYLFACAIKFVEVSIFALLGLALRNLSGRKLQYRQLWRMAAYSITLPTFFFAIMAAFKTNVPNSFMINWFVGIIVLYLALNEIPKPKPKTDK